MSIRSSDTPVYIMGKPIKGGLPGAGQNLQFNAVADYWEAVAVPPSAPHDLLDGLIDQDTVAAAVQAGDLIYGNATPLWDRLPKGGAGSILNISAANLPAWLAAGTNGYLLVMVAGQPAWVSFGASSGYLKGGDPPTIQTGIPLADLLNAGGAAGDIIYWDGANWIRLPVGTDGDYLVLVAGVPTWVTVEAPGQLGFVGSSAAISGTTTYIPIGFPDFASINSTTESLTQLTSTRGFIITRLRARARTNTLSQNLLIGFRDDGVTVASVTLNAGAVNEVDSGALSVAVAASSLINFLVTIAAATGTVTGLIVILEVEYTI